MSAAKMMDLRDVVPRTPPEGLAHWALETCIEALDRGGLLYEAEWVEDYSLLNMLDEWNPAQKTKMVRVTCSCCGGSMLLNWGKDVNHGYGFVLPEDEEGDWAHTVTVAGDEVRCPMCGERVLVNKRAAVRSYYVTAETQVMSAALVGDEMAMLALTGWTVQWRVYKSGCQRLHVIPAEAYVFGPHDCAQLLGWRNGYSGKCGYFIQYGNRWSQPPTWKERWGKEEHIFGLTEDLIDRSCLPHCKLDVYMQPRPGSWHYPVAYLRLYQSHPNVEAVLLHGLPAVLDGLIDGQVQSHTWDKNTKGLMTLPQIDWEQTRPAQMLRLTKEELRMARSQYWGLWLWELFAGAKKCGQTLTAEDMVNAFRLGDEHIDVLIPHGHLARDVRYLMRQCEEIGAEVDDAGADGAIPDAQLLLDYWDMSWRLGRDVEDPSVRYPRDLIAAHDRADELVKQKELDARSDLFRIRRRALRKYSFLADGLLIRPAASQRELTEEGNALHHCVGTYGEKHATGSTAIFFIRRANRPKESWYTLQLDEKTLTVVQNRGKHNCARTPEVQAFEDKWLAWVRAGAPRDTRGRPVVEEKKRRGAA